MNPIDKLNVNAALKANGFAGLHERGLLPQMAFLINSHDRFRRLLTTVTPEQRKEAYEALRPHLSFQAKPLETYIMEARNEAERLRLPVYDHKTGEMKDFGSGDAQKDINQAVSAALAEHSLLFTCCKCTKQEEFKSFVPSAALLMARRAGWINNGPDREICPKCPAIRLQ